MTATGQAAPATWPTSSTSPPPPICSPFCPRSPPSMNRPPASRSSPASAPPPRSRSRSPTATRRTSSSPPTTPTRSSSSPPASPTGRRSDPLRPRRPGPLGAQRLACAAALARLPHQRQSHQDRRRQPAPTHPTAWPHSRPSKACISTAATKTKLVIAENIAQTAQFAESGNAQARPHLPAPSPAPGHFRELGSFISCLPAAYPLDSPVRASCCNPVKNSRSPRLPALAHQPRHPAELRIPSASTRKLTEALTFYAWTSRQP